MTDQPQVCEYGAPLDPDPNTPGEWVHPAELSCRNECHELMPAPSLPDPTTPAQTPEAARLEAARAALAEAQSAWYDSLPDFPTDGRCECGNDGSEYGDWQAVEIGYTRWTNGEFDTDRLHMNTNGWDDMSEGGSFEWIECNAWKAGAPNCGRAYKTPETVEYD